VTPRREHWFCRLDRGGAGDVVGVEVERHDGNRLARHVRVEGPQLVPVIEPLVSLLQRAGVNGPQLTGSHAFPLSDPPGPQVELMLDAVSAVRRHDRLVGIAHGVAGMSTEEATYWHARSHRPGGLPALRTLLAGGRR
jgi:hypothetical protein